MFNINDDIIYGEYGVCRISGIVEKNFGDKNIPYYSLKPIFNCNSIYYVPVSNENVTSKFRKLLDKDQITDIFSAVPSFEYSWIENEKERKEVYKAILSSGDRMEVARLIKNLRCHQAIQASNNKKVHISDDKFLKEAEQSLFQEFSFVLGLDISEIAEKFLSQL